MRMESLQGVIQQFTQSIILACKNNNISSNEMLILLFTVQKYHKYLNKNTKHKKLIYIYEQSLYERRQYNVKSMRVSNSHYQT